VNKTAIVFVHGFTGNSGTWINEDGVSFAKLLETFSEFDELDFHHFEYHTAVFNFANNKASKMVTSILNKMLPQKYQRKIPTIKKNTPISEIAEELLTYIKYDLENYSNIIFVCHSMGGLVVKNLIVTAIENDSELEQNIIGYCSLATPHIGAIPSMLLSPFNVNAKEMTPLNRDNIVLNNLWIKHASKIDKTLYVTAKSDEIVDNISTVPSTDKKIFPSELIEADHTSICKPENASSKIIKITKKFITDCIKRISLDDYTLDEKAEVLSQYDQEIFVIKLVLADVDENLIDDSKNCFFLAEIANKKASRRDREAIAELTTRIISIYKTISGSGVKRTSSELLSQVHEKIIDSDKQALSFAVSYISFLHKTGFLHQQSNVADLNVNWSSNATLEAIKKHKENSSD
jgi:hypothetical protein